MNWLRINFIVWLLSFIVNLWIEHWILDILCIITTLGFIIELIFEYRKSNSIKDFISNNYIDIILLIPIFKILRLGKFARLGKLKRVLSLGDMANDVIELVFRFFRR